jgi:hypothetical protein
MPRAYTEDQLVEHPAIGLVAELGWQTVSAAVGNLRCDPHVAASGVGPGKSDRRKMCPERVGTKMSIPLDVFVHTGGDKNVHQLDEHGYIHSST